MAHDNSLNENDQPYKRQRTSEGVYYDDISEKSLKQNWWHKNTKRRQSTLAQEKHTNAAAW